MEKTIFDLIMGPIATEIGKIDKPPKELSDEEYALYEFNACTEKAFKLGIRLGMELKN